MYRAIHNISVCGEMYFKGDTIPGLLPDDQAQWLKSVGAIKEIAPSPSKTGAAEKEAKKPVQKAAGKRGKEDAK